MKREFYFSSLATIGSPHITCKNTIGLYVDGYVVGAIYWIVTSNTQGYNVIMQKKDLGTFVTLEKAKKVATDFAKINFSNLQIKTEGQK